MFKIFSLIGTSPEFRFFNLGSGFFYFLLICALVKMIINNN